MKQLKKQFDSPPKANLFHTAGEEGCAPSSGSSSSDWKLKDQDMTQKFIGKPEGNDGSLKNWCCPEEDYLLGDKLKEEESLKEIVKVEFKKEDGDRDCTK